MRARPWTTVLKGVPPATSRCLALTAVLWLAAVLAIAQSTSGRDTMLDAIRTSIWNTAEHTGISELSAPVMEAMASVPREHFVLPGTKRVRVD